MRKTFRVGDRVQLEPELSQSSRYGVGTVTECPGWFRRRIYTIAWDNGSGCGQWHAVFLTLAGQGDAG